MDFSACLTPVKDSRKEERKESLRLQGDSKQVSARLTRNPRAKSLVGRDSILQEWTYLVPVLSSHLLAAACGKHDLGPNPGIGFRA